MNKLVCPEPEIISAFVFGRLEDDDIDRVAAHLEECAECLSAVQTLDEANDTLLSRLEGASSAGSIELPDVCRQALAQAAALVNAGEDEATTAGRVVPRLGRVGNYELIEELGRGGMGTVYKALHVNLKRLVALKVLPAEKMQDRRAVARFRREMEAVGKLVHPNIVLAHDAGEADGQHFLVMEFVEGLDLAQIADRRGPLAVADACELVRQAAMGLEHAHQHGLVHRDIKPSNLILSAHGQTKILDLGLALLDAGQPTESDLTGDCQMMGTTDYMAPEQAGDSHAVDIRADIYSLGCTLYKLLVGRAPFSGPQYNSTLKKLMAHAQTRVTPVHEARPDVPLALSAVVERMMAKSAGDRFAAPREVAAALAPFAAGANLPALLERGRQAPTIERRIIATTATASGCASALEPTVEKEADSVKTAPAADTSDAPLVVVGPRSSFQRNRGRKRWLVAALGVAAAVLLAGIVVIVKTKSGQTKRIELPDDARVIQVENNGNHMGSVSIPDPTKQVATREKTAIPADHSGVPGIATRNSAAVTIDRRVAEHVLALGGTLDVLYRANAKHVAVLGDLPADSFKITGIGVNSPLVHSDHIAMFSQLRHLGNLDLTGTLVGDDELAAIARLRTLRSLGLTATKVTGDGLALLESLERLTRLNLTGIKLSAVGCREIAKFTRLEELYLDDTSINDEGLAALQGLSRLRELSLASTRISDAGLKSLADMKNLERLVLTSTRVSGAGLTHLAPLKRLDTLVLDATWLNDEHVKELQRFPALHEVSLRDTRLTDAAVEPLAQASSLTKIDLENTRISDEGRRRLGNALTHRAAATSSAPLHDLFRLSSRDAVSRRGVVVASRGTNAINGVTRLAKSLEKQFSSTTSGQAVWRTTEDNSAGIECR